MSSHLVTFTDEPIFLACSDDLCHIRSHVLNWAAQCNVIRVAQVQFSCEDDSTPCWVPSSEEIEWKNSVDGWPTVGIKLWNSTLHRKQHLTPVYAVKALVKSSFTSTWSCGRAYKYLRATWIAASQPPGIPTPSWRGWKKGACLCIPYHTILLLLLLLLFILFLDTRYIGSRGILEFKLTEDRKL